MPINAGASLCMVDNDRFMAIMNSHDKKCYLHAMNQTKLSVVIADACVNRYKNYSMYHNIYHKIITAGDLSAEWYDINKDKSMIIADYADYPKPTLQNIWYSPFNPAILYFSGYTEDVLHIASDHVDSELYVYGIDLRDRKAGYQTCKTIRLDRWKWWQHLYLRG